MADKFKNVTGWNQISANLKTATTGIGKRIPQAFNTAGLYLQGESQKLVPVDIGPLKGSAFTRNSGEGLSGVVTVGYTSNYAMYIHEHPNGLNAGRFGRPRAKGHKGFYWDPSGIGQSKFLEQPSRDANHRRIMLNIIRNTLKIAGKGFGATVTGKA